MKCCNVEPIIIGSKTVLKDDKKYIEFTMQCVNPQCSNYLKTWEETIAPKA